MLYLTKTVEAISKSNVPASTTGVDIKADVVSEQVNIDSLRQNPKLQKQVKKELSELGLKVISLKNESSSSESESSQTSSTSDSELSKKKKKKNISLRKIRPLLKPHLMMIVIFRRRKSITLRMHNHCPHVENMHILLCAHLINIFSFLRGVELRHFFSIRNA